MSFDAVRSSNSGGSQASTSSTLLPPVPYVRILHQPSSIYRMRYKAENRTTFLFSETNNEKNAAEAASSGSKKSAARKKNGALNATNPDGVYPKIEIVNGQGPATLIVSCVNYKEPYHVHPHRLIGECCKSGVAVINIGRGETQFELAGVSIQFTKRHDIAESINELKSKNVDPYNVSFNFDQNGIDLTQLRLCFQVYLRDSLESNEIIRDQYHILKPVVSNIIYNSARKSTLQIVKQASMSSPANGGSLVILFLKKLDKDQKILRAKFYEPSLNSSSSLWETEVELKDDNIHQQCAIMFPAPPYRDKESMENKKCFLKLYVPFKDEADKAEFLRQQITDESSEENYDNTTNIDGKYESKPVEFTYTPSEFKLNKRKLDTEPFYFASTFLEPAERDMLNDDNKMPRKNLAKKYYGMLSQQINLENTAISELIFNSASNKLATDPLANNFIIKNADLFIPLTTASQQASSTSTTVAAAATGGASGGLHEPPPTPSANQMQTFISDYVTTQQQQQPHQGEGGAAAGEQMMATDKPPAATTTTTASATVPTTATASSSASKENTNKDDSLLSGGNEGIIDFENISGQIYDVIENIDKPIWTS